MSNVHPFRCRIIVFLVILAVSAGVCVTASAQSMADFLTSIPRNPDFIRSVSKRSEAPKGYYPLSSASDLYEIARSPGGKYILMNDIDISRDTTLKNELYNCAFCGELDGNGYLINMGSQNWTYTGEEIGLSGLFCYAENATIRNLRLTGSVTLNYQVSQYWDWMDFYVYTPEILALGGLVGMTGENVTIMNCTVDVPIQIIGTGIKSEAGFYTDYLSDVGDWTICTGGIVGMIAGDNNSISYCRNMGNIIAFTDVAGICGLDYGNHTEIYACENYGSITGMGVAVGGISGFHAYNASIRSCANWGMISGANIAGGITGMGVNWDNNERLEIISCANMAPVTADFSLVADMESPFIYCAAGGIVGSYDARIESCLNVGNVIGVNGGGAAVNGYSVNPSLITNCIVSGSSKSIALGDGFTSLTVSDCISLVDDGLLANQDTYNQYFSFDQNAWSLRKDMRSAYPTVLLEVEGFIWPTVSTEVSTLFYYSGAYEKPYASHGWGDPIDIPGTVGDPIYAVSDGTVSEVHELTKSYGKHIYIIHPDGSKVIYAHLNKINVKANQEVKQGDIIGELGHTGNSTGPHLHFAWDGGNAWSLYYKNLHLSYHNSVYDANTHYYGKDPRSTEVIDWFKLHYTDDKGNFTGKWQK